jgi:DNA-binding CsgD family transcriptional regulator
MLPAERAVERFREAALEPSLWPKALGELAHALDSDGATLVLQATKAGSVAVSESIQPFLSQYLSGAIPDPREHRVHPTLRDGFLPDRAHFSAAEIEREPYYRDFLRPNGFGWNAVAALQGGLMLSLKRAHRRGEYEGADLAALNAALPLLRGTSRMASLVWRSRFEGHLSAFARLGRGALLVDARGRVLDFNDCLRLGNGLDIKAGFLSAHDSRQAAELRRFLQAVMSWKSAEEAPVLVLPGPAGTPAWLLDGIACTEALRSLHCRGGAALVVVTDLSRPSRTRPEVLRRAYGLTPTECALAASLGAGLSLQQAAVELDISVPHARQRLQSLFCKTRTARQGELVALLSRLA